MSKLTVKEKIGYGLGDGASNIIWQTIMLFMAYFYTDIYGLSAFHMGIMFLVVRILDAFFDVYIGFLADHTSTKHGQFRPYLLWFSLPFGILGSLTFFTPEFGETGKLIYAYVSYTALSLLYTLVNVPYCAMINNLSQNPEERVSMQSYRFAFAALGGIIVSVIALPLTKTLGGGNLQHGYFYAMVLMGLISTVMFYLCFALTNEKYARPVDKTQKFSTVFKELRHLSSDRNWRKLFLLNVVNLTAGILKTGGAMYFVTYYLHRPDLVSIILTIILGAKFVGSMFTTALYSTLDRLFAYKMAMTVQAAIMIGLFFVPAQYVVVICVIIGCIHFINSTATPLQWSLLSDIIDHIESKAGKSFSGLVFSTNIFAIKVGIAIGGALMGWLLTVGGYIGNSATQADTATLCIRLIFTVIPAMLILSLIPILRKYNLDQKKDGGAYSQKNTSADVLSEVKGELR
ncbi:glycoside-pentoside-hexuronide (GPH):cation symporter [Serratia plymuthica]|uniref:MFS transporter n=2 Tax=Serratia plymuthica TaxID=82996 RepID=A0A7T2WB01_SERPL|nr:glycoside-pentoside-hexuronide (GPH):cation symporter [Serratia plymuthica]QPS21055.1 MFS transporter [Serratia plymuthica]QPS62662.1 MFS transporter [Serratia plymuthica]RKS65027.1 sugar (glycoside-pentoside-hexuronide) transporter [Serratia plymuthica]CAI2426771.1 Inner membrane symporter yicJ [Serratia plymuthica]